MPCFQHPGYQELPALRIGTEVFLPSKPNMPNTPVALYFWNDESKGCEQHTTPMSPSFTFTHKGRLTREIAGFVAAGVCRGSSANRVLYTFPGRGADVNNISQANTPVCE